MANDPAKLNQGTPSGKKNYKANTLRTATGENQSQGGGQYAISAENPFHDQQYHQACGNGVDTLLIRAMRLQSLDNLSVVMIGLKGFKKALQQAWEVRRNVGSGASISN